MRWVDTQLDEARYWELLRISTDKRTSQGWLVGREWAFPGVAAVQLHNGRNARWLIPPASITGVARPVCNRPWDWLWLELRRSFVGRDGRIYRKHPNAGMVL
jgi:hypothetical protein